MIHLQSIEIRPSASLPPRYPFTLPVVRGLDRLPLVSPVTFFVGENGSGKSTLLEAIAAASQLPAVGDSTIERDDTLTAARELSRELRLTWGKRTHRGFFLRSEDFFNFARRMRELVREMETEAAQYDKELTGYGRRVAMGVMLGEKARIIEKYGEDLDANSHGEAFLKVFGQRIVPDGLYLLDEPETPLSPLRQLALLSMLKHAVEDDSAQFIIATHSPILMAFPGATIYSFDSAPIREVSYEELDHVRLTRDFLRDPERFLRQL